MKLPGPNELAERFLLNHFTKEKRCAFLTAIITGIFTHFILLANGMMSQDGLCQSIRYYAGEAEISVGRWGVKLFEQLRANYALTFLSAVISILLVAIAAVLLTDLFQIRSVLGAALTAGILETAPALVVTMLYEYVSDLYFLSLCFAIIAALFLIRCRKKLLGSLFAAIFIMLSMSIYQSYIGFTAGICVMVTILSLLDPESDVRVVAKDFLRYLITGIIGFLFYFISVKIDQAIEHIGASAYNGVSDLTPMTILQSLPFSISNTYHSFLRYFIRDDYIYNTNWHRDIFFVIFFLCFFAIILFLIIKDKLYRNIGKLIFLLVLGLCIPVSLNLFQLIVPNSQIYALTSMQMVLVIPFFLSVAENRLQKRLPIIQWCAAGMIILSFVTYFFADVLSYRALEETYDQCLYGANRILDRMENTEGYDKDMPVVFAGWFNDASYPQDQSFWDYSLGYLVTNRTIHGDFYANTESIRRFYLQFPGIYLNMAPPALYQSIIETDDFKKMGIYPALDSVKIIDGVMVVKMMEEPYQVY